MHRTDKPFALILALVAFGSAGVGRAQAALTYEYVGLNFTSVTGSNPQVTTSDRITGFVTFAAEPLPNQTGKRDVIAFSLADGARTLSSAAGDTGPFLLNDFFDFDAAGRIVDWKFDAVPQRETGNANILQTTPSFDFSRLGSGLVQEASNAGGGAWTAVPEPSSLALLGLGGVALLRRRRA